MGARKCKIVLLQDNFSGHIILDGLQNICVMNFKPNLIAHVQPIDQGIISCFKGHYHAGFIQHLVNCYDTNITPSEIYKIDQLQAMYLANITWQEVDTTMIRNCWHKAGIMPTIDSPTAPTQPAIPISSLLHTPSNNQDPPMTAKNAL